MPILTFKKEWDEKLRSHEKMQTMRANVGYWKKAKEKKRDLFVWCPSPRGGKGVKLGYIPHGSWSIEIKNAADITDDDAILDGFEDRDELFLWMDKGHKELEMYDIVTMDWAIINWSKIVSQ